MVKVSFKTAENDESFIIIVEGHAGQADPGQDIICASASILVYTLAQTVTDMHNAGRLRKKPRIRIENGDAEIVLKPKKGFFSEAFLTVHTIKRGFDLLCSNFPDFVSYMDD